MTTLEISGSLSGHRAAVNSVCLAGPSDTCALSSSDDGTVRLWDLRTRRAVRAVFASTAASVSDDSLGSCASVDTGEPGKGILVAAGAELLVFDLRGSDQVLFRGAPAARAKGADDVNDFSVSRDGRMVAAPLDTGDIELFSLPNLEPIRTLSGGHENIAGSARFRGADGSELYTGGFDQRLVLWDPRNGKLRTKLEAKQMVPPVVDDETGQVGGTLQIMNPPFVLGLSVGPSEELAVGLGDGSILAFPHDKKPPRGEAPWKVSGAHLGPTDAIAWLTAASHGSRQLPVLASAGRDLVVRLWSVDFRACGGGGGRKRSAVDGDAQVAHSAVAALPVHEKPNALSGGSDGQTLLLADTSGVIKVLQARS